MDGIRYRRSMPAQSSSKFMGDVLGYARVSTGDQDVAGQTMRLGEAGAIKVFTDVRSGKSMDRPGLTALLAYARKGDTLAVVRLDRLGRSLAELISIVEQLKARGVALLSPGGKDRYLLGRRRADTSIGLFRGAIAHFERRLIAERTKDGIAAARARGKGSGGRPTVRRSQQGSGGDQAGRGGALTYRSGEPARPRSINGLSGSCRRARNEKGLIADAIKGGVRWGPDLGTAQAKC